MNEEHKSLAVTNGSSKSLPKKRGRSNETVGKVSIYALCDFDKIIRYIGKAKNPAARFQSHMRDALKHRGLNLHKEAWIRSMHLAKHDIELRILEWCDEENWETAERKWITQHLETLTNQAPGGQQPVCNAETRKKNAKRLHEHPEYALMIAIRILNNYARCAVSRGNIDSAKKLLEAVIVLKESKGNARERLVQWATERFKYEKITIKAA
jgi:hypothetical protein